MALRPEGGGGNPLRAWLLAWFDVAYSCIDWFLGCFVKFIRHPELVSGSCDVYVVNIKSSLARDDLGGCFCCVRAP